MGRQRSYINQGSKKIFKTRAVVGYFDGPNLYGAQLIRVIKGIIKGSRYASAGRCLVNIHHLDSRQISVREPSDLTPRTHASSSLHINSRNNNPVAGTNGRVAETIPETAAALQKQFLKQRLRCRNNYHVAKIWRLQKQFLRQRLRCRNNS